MRKVDRYVVTDSEMEETKQKPSPTRAHLLMQHQHGQDQGHRHL